MEENLFGNLTTLGYLGLSWCVRVHVSVCVCVFVCMYVDWVVGVILQGALGLVTKFRIFFSFWVGGWILLLDVKRFFGKFKINDK